MARLRSAPGVFELGLQFQIPERVGPHVLEHAADRPECLTPCPVQAMAPLAADVDQTRLDQGPELKRDGAEGDVGHRRVNLTRGPLVAPDQAENLAPPW